MLLMDPTGPLFCSASYPSFRISCQTVRVGQVSLFGLLLLNLVVICFITPEWYPHSVKLQTLAHQLKPLETEVSKKRRFLYSFVPRPAFKIPQDLTAAVEEFAQQEVGPTEVIWTEVQTIEESSAKRIGVLVFDFWICSNPVNPNLEEILSTLKRFIQALKEGRQSRESDLMHQFFNILVLFKTLIPSCT